MHSGTVDNWITRIGTGKTSVAECCRTSRDLVTDGVQHPAIREWATLGASGNQEQHQERDLHRWLKKLGLEIEPDILNAKLPCKDGIGTFDIDVPILYPHELFHAIFN
eukprot:6380395-Pyramimonas_sp.AAC.1